MMVAAFDHVVRLADGRRLGYAEYGDPAGKAVVLVHGCPDSRVIGQLGASAATRQGVRLIAPDRPGFGLSDPKPGRSILDWPEDLAELADTLSLDHFPVVGLSAGCAFAAACAWKLPERISALGICCGIGPLDRSGMTNEMQPAVRLTYRLARQAPWLLRMLVQLLAHEARKAPQRAGQWMLATRPEIDRVVMQRPEIYQVLLDNFPEQFRDPATIVHEFQLGVRPWGFPLEEIVISTWLWQGLADTVHPPAIGRYMAATIPGCRASFLAGAGGAWFIDHFDTVLAAVTTPPTI
jgi:pimeloyl-ACP methyl ester carboxylesterase